MCGGMEYIYIYIQQYIYIQTLSETENTLGHQHLPYDLPDTEMSNEGLTMVSECGVGAVFAHNHNHWLGQQPDQCHCR